MRKRTLWIIIVAIGVAALALAAAGYWRKLQQSASVPTATPAASTAQDFTVPAGATLRQVLQALQQQQLITDARAFEQYLRCCEPGKSLAKAGVKAGHYRIEPNQTPLAILRQLTEGRVALESLTIVEGWRFSQMRQLIESQSMLEQTFKGRPHSAIMAALGVPELHPEGQFAADTYRFARGSSDLSLYRQAYEQQQKQLTEAWASRARDLPLKSPAEALVMASIVEKETGLASERPRIAGVFMNRLNRRMRLQSDPTVIYGIGDRYDGDIRRSDLTRDSVYNTYTRDGLPPTPIALPGRDAIRASLQPEATDDIFFVAIGDGSGGHYFSSTLAEHNRAVQRYLQRLRTDPPGSTASVSEGP